MGRTRARSTVPAGLVVLLLASTVSAVTITVNTTDDELNTDGDCSVREALMAAGSDSPYDGCVAGSGRDTVFLPAGTYTLTSGYLWLSGELDVEGESEAATVIDGAGSNQIFRRQGASAAVEVRNLTVTNGQAPAGVFGGAIGQGSNYDTTFRNVTIEWCRTDSRGGAIYIGDGVFRLIDCTVTNNESVDYGGAVYLGGGRLEATRTWFHSNDVSSDSIGSGGAVYDHSPSGSVDLDLCTFTNNTAKYGGAVAGLGDLIISGSLFYANLATSHGGAVYASAVVVNSTFSGNWAGTSDPMDVGDGGAIRSTGNLEIYSSTFYNNMRYVGGSSEGNTLSASGALIACSILRVPSGANCLTSMISGGYNVASDASCGLTGPGDLSGVDPMLTALIDNGGPTMTHSPIPGSPVIDAGNPAGCTWNHDADPGTPEAELRIDQRGFLRPWDGDGDDVPVCDPGSVEYGAPEDLFSDGFESGNTSLWSAIG